MPQQPCFTIPQVENGADNGDEVGLEKSGIAGARASDEGAAYYRFLKNVDVADSAGQQQIMALVDIFNRQALRVVVDPSPEEGSAVADFFDELRKQPCLHFV